MVRAEPEVELALEPDGLGILVVQPGVVAREGRPGHLAQRLLLLAVPEAAPAPADVEQVQHLGECLAAFGVVALEDLVDDDAEPLVDSLFGGDAEYARELVSQGTAAVGVDVR